MRSLIVRLVRAGMRRGFTKGVVEGNQTWLIVGAAALLAHLAGRALGKEEHVIFSEALAPGESFVIRNVPAD